jgi:hypothetical protein
LRVSWHIRENALCDPRTCNAPNTPLYLIEA